MSIRIFSALLLSVVCAWVHAGLVIQGSRIIYDEAQGEASVQMQYVGDAPTLLQAWMDTGDDTAAPGEEDIPFVLMPAVTRLDPGNGQTIRVMRIRDGLPQERESIFYFNTLEVPPAPTAQLAAGEAYMQFSIRGRFKFFYRPKGLPMSSGKAFELLQFSLTGPDADGLVQVQVENPSPYYVTFSSLTLRHAGAGKDDAPLLGFTTESPGERMVAPMGRLLIPLDTGTLPEGSRLPSGVELEYTIINDSGGLQSAQRRVG